MNGLDLSVLVGLVVCGTAIGVGALIGNGALQLAGAYFGWFLGAYSLMRYIVQAIRLALRSEVPLWGTVIPVNCALALMGVAAFGVHDSSAVQFAMVVFTCATMLGVLLSSAIPTLVGRFIPLALIGLLALPFHEWLSAFWAPIYIGVASLLLASSVVELTKRKKVEK